MVNLKDHFNQVFGEEKTFVKNITKLLHFVSTSNTLFKKKFLLKIDYGYFSNFKRKN